MILGPLPEIPLVSVITPSLNQGQFVEETIQSVLAQGYPRIEYIVVDGGSTDGTLAVLRRYEGRLSWLSEPDRGQSDAINKGFRMAQGDILTWLCSDDTYLPGAVSKIFEAFRRYPEAGMIYGGCYFTDAEGRILQEFPEVDFDLRRLIRCGLGSYIPQPATFYRREVLDVVGLLDEDLQFCMDFDYSIRIGQHLPVRRIPDVLATYRLHSGSKSVAQAWRQTRIVWQIGRKYGAPLLSPRTLDYLWVVVQCTPVFEIAKATLPASVKRAIYRSKDALASRLA